MIAPREIERIFVITDPTVKLGANQLKVTRRRSAPTLADRPGVLATKQLLMASASSSLPMRCSALIRSLKHV